MNNSTPGWFKNLQIADLEPIVRQILDRSEVELLDWHIQSVSGGAAEHTRRGYGIYRVSGTAQADHRETPWEAVVKVVGPTDRTEQNDPADSDYWKREVLLYQSGILDQLPGNVAAPRCYALQELPDGKVCIWLEAVQETTSHWTMDEHGLAARHLGQFNGAYLAGHPLPERAAWMLPGRTRGWVERFSPDSSNLLQFSGTRSGQWLSSQSIERMIQLWEQRDALLTALDRLPDCFCHHDAFRRNLMLRQSENGGIETVAIDWSYTGPGKVGEEIGITTGVNLFFMDVPAERARELDEAVFSGYSAGLHDAGWQGDIQLARFGYTLTAALAFGLAFSVTVANGMQRSGSGARAEAIVGHPIDEIIEQQAVVVPFLLDLGDEALELMAVI